MNISLAAFFNRLSKNYEDFAWLSEAIGDGLIERLNYLKAAPERILDLGCASGRYTRALHQRYPKAATTGIDFSEGMIARAQAKIQETSMQGIDFLCEEATHTSVATQSVDLIFANLLLPYVDPVALMQECLRLLKPQGVLLFSSLGPDTFYELRQASGRKENRLRDMHHLGDLLLKQGFADPVVDLEYKTATFPDLTELLYSLKLSGYYTANASFTRGQFEALAEAYEDFRDEEGLLPVTLEVIYGQAWQGDLASKQTQDENGTVRVPVSRLFL